jgi:uncharacterized protein (DUF362 family)
LNIVAPPGNQTVNGEYKHQFIVSGETDIPDSMINRQEKGYNAFGPNVSGHLPLLFLLQEVHHMVRVGLARGSKSCEAVSKALELVRGDVHVPANRPVLIKTNMVSPIVELAATPVDAVRATMDFLTSLGVKKFIVAEGTAGQDGDTMGAFQSFGYLSLKDRFDVEFRNLHDDDKIVFEALDADMTPITIHLAKSLFTLYLVSVSRMKTHRRVIVTLSIKNVAIGAIHNPDRHTPVWHVAEPGKFSHDPRPLNLCIARLNQTLTPDLVVVDGVVGMEGEGPSAGTPVTSGVALAGTSALAVDLVGAEVMGFDPRTVGYLWYLSQVRKLSREEVQVLGENLANCVTRYEPFEGTPELLGWYVKDWKRHLHGDYIR